MTPYIFRGMLLPLHLQESLDAYAQEGRPTGGFLQECINNNLRMAVARADDKNVLIIPAVIAYLYNRAPAGCWGRDGAHDRWIWKHAEARLRKEGKDSNNESV